MAYASSVYAEHDQTMCQARTFGNSRRRRMATVLPLHERPQAGQPPAA